jgi:phosphoribosylformimino-5-aminoimidazole carboxamide ribotide isomerase
VIVIPAIDLLDGRAARLAQGDPERATYYSDSPWEVAERFASANARRIHVVDLDGAFAGEPRQLELVARVVDRAHRGDATVEVGGGIRDADAAAAVLATGADYAIIGTFALRDPRAAARLCADQPDRIIVAIDARDGLVAVDGWRETSTIPAHELAKTAERWGAAAVLHTDVARDGLQTGPAVEATRAVQRALSIPVIASGGVGTLADIAVLRDAGIRAVVVGRALYEGSFTIEEALTSAC